MAGKQAKLISGEAMFIRLRLLGDIVFTLPALSLFKEHFPSVRLHYVVEERYREIAGLLPGIDKVVAVPAARGYREVLDFRRLAREAGIGAVIDFHSGPASALLTRASGARLRIGYRTPNRNWAYNRLVQRTLPGQPVHSVVSQARLLEPLGIAGEKIPGYPRIDSGNFPVSPRLATAVSLQPKVIVHLGAGNRFRDWGEDRFRELARRLGGQAAVVLVGGSDLEQRRAARLAALDNVHDLSGPLGVRELLKLVESAAAYVGADSGPLHLASLTRTPIVALYGPNLSAISGPWRSSALEIIELDMACRPCSQRRCKYGTIPCMRDISTDRVHEAVSRFLH